MIQKEFQLLQDGQRPSHLRFITALRQVKLLARAMVCSGLIFLFFRNECRWLNCIGPSYCRFRGFKTAGMFTARELNKASKHSLPINPCPVLVAIVLEPQAVLESFICKPSGGQDRAKGRIAPTTPVIRPHLLCYTLRPGVGRVQTDTHHSVGNLLTMAASSPGSN